MNANHGTSQLRARNRLVPAVSLAGIALLAGCHSLGTSSAETDPVASPSASASSGKEPAALGSSQHPSHLDQASYLLDVADAPPEASADASAASADGEFVQAVEEFTIPLEGATGHVLATTTDESATPVNIQLETLESIALESHPVIQQAKSLVSAARGQVLQSGLPFNPQFQYQSQEIGSAGVSGLHSLALSQQFVTANKLGLAQQVQTREVQKQLARLRIAQLQVLTRLRAAFAKTLVAQERVRLTKQIVDIAQQSVDAVNALLAAKQVSQVALLQVEVDAERAAIAAENAMTQYEANRRELAAALGGAALPDGPLAGEPDDSLPESPWDNLLEEIISLSPELSLAGAELERAKRALQLACAQVVPNVTARAGVGYDAGSDDTFAMVGVFVPLPIRNRNQGNIRTARAEIAAASAAIEETQVSLQGRLAEALGRYQVSRNRYKRLSESVIPTAERSFELSQLAFQAGELNFLELLNAQRALFSTRLEAIGALGQAKQAAADIEGALVEFN